MRVYRYGLLAPTENEAIVREQIYLAHKMKNTHVEIERGRRSALREVVSAPPDVEAAANVLAAAHREERAAIEAIRLARRTTRDRSETEEMRARVKTARAARKDATKSHSEARRAARAIESVVSGSDGINERAGELRRSTRAHSGLGECGPYKGAWGTYLLVEAAADAQRKKLPLYRTGEPNDPQFRRFRGEGAIGVQLQGGLPVFALESDTQIRVMPAPDLPARGDGSPRRRGRGALEARELWIRVYTADDGRSPVWAKFPMRMHRPIPPGAVIKAAKVVLRKIGPREEWSLHMTIDDSAVEKSGCGEGVVAIDVGWRAFDDGVRVAMWTDDAGAAGELHVSSRVLDLFDKCDGLRSVRSMNFDEQVGVLRDWLSADAEKEKPTIPEWLRLECTHLHAWKSPTRIARLRAMWRERRFDGDATQFDVLDAWCGQDHHLWEWETSQRQKALRLRRDVFRCFAADLARRHRILVLEKFDLRNFARRAAVDVKAENETARRNRHAVAVSEMRGALINAFLARGGEVTHVAAHQTTKKCHACGEVEVFDAAVEIVHACSKCGTSWDQDDNASINLLARCGERPRDARDVGTTREGENTSDSAEAVETKWVRAKRLQAERRTRMETARQPAPEPAE